MPTLAKGPNNKKKPNNIKRSAERRISKIRKKSLSPNGRNNSSQAYKAIKKGPKESKRAQRRK